MPEDWVIQVLTVMVCAFGILLWMFHLRTKYQRQAIDNVQCKMITEQGTSYKVLKAVEKGLVMFPPNKKKGKKGKAFPVAEFATYQIEYPEGWIPRWLKTTIREGIWREDTWEPLYNRGNPLLDPEMLYNVINEKFTEVGLAHSQSEAESARELAKRTKERLNPSTVYLLLGAIAIAVGAVLVFVLMNKETIEKMAGV